MKRSLIILPVVVMILFGAQAVFAQGAVIEDEIPVSIRNNRYFVESVRLGILAQQAFDEGDYLASTQFSEEAVRFADLSDEYVLLQFEIWQTDQAITAARHRLTYAVSINASTRYPDEYATAQAAFAEALAYRSDEEWESSREAAGRVLATLAAITDPPVIAEPGQVFLPAQYTVRPWAIYRDSLWNIAGRAWAFNDPWQWRRLYEANSATMPQPGNPNLIEPGQVLNIPSIRGETRQGMWEPGVEYPSLP